jgi:hypothetical protein
MMRKRLLALLGLTFCGFAVAGPALSVTKPPVVGGPNAGPSPQDPDSVQGQWFLDKARGGEFYDNVTGFGGGLASSGAIRGYTSNIQTDGFGNITGFDIIASITNDTDTVEGLWMDGSNSHGETLSTTEMYVGTLYDTMLAIEFAILNPLALPSQFLPPYYQGQLPMIEALNEENAAWYCYNDNEGNYYVPAWDFGDIALGQTSTKTLQFGVVGGTINPGDPRFQIITENELPTDDILLNRTTSLKLSHWIEDMADDTGTPYPVPPALSSNASVFFVPEPTSLGLLVLGGAALLRRKRRR